MGENNKLKLSDIDYLVLYDEYMWFLHYVGYLKIIFCNKTNICKLKSLINDFKKYEILWL